MFDHVREDYQTHGRRLSNRALWAMLHYRFGIWAAYARFAPLRWLLGKVYGAVGLYLPLVTGIFIDRRMVVGRRFHIIHPAMVLLHPEATFGDDCGIMHNVTVGTNMTGTAPTIGNDVFIGCGATILGDVTIGDGVRIAANTLVIGDVPAGAMAMGVPARVYAGHGHGKAAEDARAASDPKRRQHEPAAPQVPQTPAPTIVPASTSATFRGAPRSSDATVS
jgi:serine O-acetyltransferase